MFGPNNKAGHGSFETSYLLTVAVRHALARNSKAQIGLVVSEEGRCGERNRSGLPYSVGMTLSDVM